MTTKERVMLGLRIFARVIMIGTIVFFVTAGYVGIQQKLDAIMETQKLNTLQLMMMQKTLAPNVNGNSVGNLAIQEPTDDEIDVKYLYSL